MSRKLVVEATHICRIFIHNPKLNPMLLIQLTGLSGAGKSTLAYAVRQQLQVAGIPAEVVDGDVYRRTLCKDLGFSREDRCENIRRLGKVAFDYVTNNTVAILAAINPYEAVRQELRQQYDARTVFISCDLPTLVSRDTKGLYHRALLADDHPDKLFSLTGVNDPYDTPVNPDLVLHTNTQSLPDSVRTLTDFIVTQLGNAVKDGASFTQKKAG